MRVNKVKELWNKNQVAIGGWLTIPSGISTEIMAHQKWDVLTIDMQHALVRVSDMVPIITAISATDVIPFVRVPCLDQGL